MERHGLDTRGTESEVLALARPGTRSTTGIQEVTPDEAPLCSAQHTHTHTHTHSPSMAAPRFGWVPTGQKGARNRYHGGGGGGGMKEKKYIHVFFGCTHSIQMFQDQD